uniref:Uncharacterized protein n=1 Tax=Panagrolaimus sp. JU765 TaxID=591449 RepID=A0AC34QL12_9BILA
MMDEHGTDDRDEPFDGQQDEDPGADVGDHVEEVNVGMAQDTAKRPSAVFEEHKIRGVLEDAEDPDQQIGHGEVGQEKVGDGSH